MVEGNIDDWRLRVDIQVSGKVVGIFDRDEKSGECNSIGIVRVVLKVLMN